MPNYQLGKIYKITSNQTNKIYVGATVQPRLCYRFQKHKAAYKSWLNNKGHYITSFEILKFDDAQILLIENCPCNTKDELTAREAYHIKLNLDNCVNKLLSGRTKEKTKHLHYCPTCEYKGPTKEALYNHKKSHKTEIITNYHYKCTLCNKLIRDLGNAKQHLKSQSHNSNVVANTENQSCNIIVKINNKVLHKKRTRINK